MIYYGDEVGLNGGADPDCRRGMLWDAARQDRDLLSWYQKLIRLRRQEPLLTEGELADQYAEDGKGLLVMERRLGKRRAVLAFHTAEGSLSLPELRGKLDRISETEFSGSLGAYEVAVLVEEDGEA